MFLHLAFANGSNPYVFFGSVSAVEEDLGFWKRFWNVRILKTTSDGIFAEAKEKGTFEPVCEEDEIRCVTDPAIPEDSQCAKCCIHCSEKATCQYLCPGVSEFGSADEIRRHCSSAV